MSYRAQPSPLPPSLHPSPSPQTKSKRSASLNRHKLVRLFDRGLASVRPKAEVGSWRAHHLSPDESDLPTFIDSRDWPLPPVAAAAAPPPLQPPLTPVTHAPSARRQALRFNTSANEFYSPTQPSPGSQHAQETRSPLPSSSNSFRPQRLRPALKERSATSGPLFDRPYHDPRNKTSFNWRAGNMAGTFDPERQRTRRERTFIGSECSVCDEPLEHTLRGERVLQFSCGHVAHEACFYEYVREPDSQYCPKCNEPLGLDTSRGGNVLDMERLGNIVRSAAGGDYHLPARSESNASAAVIASPTVDGSAAAHTPVWPDRPRSRDGQVRTQRRDYRPSFSQEPYDRYEGRQHARNDSGNSGPASVNDYADPAAAAAPVASSASANGGRRHDYDVHSMETPLSSPRTSVIKNPVPPPTVTVRSEFPTLNKSRQPQPLTCLVTIEVPALSWKPDPVDVTRGPNPSSAPARPDEVAPARPPSPPPQPQQPFSPPESSEVLEAVTENLRARVDNWHGLDFRRFGKLRLYANVRVGKDGHTWQELECYLFSEMLICVKEKKNSGAPDWDDSDVRPKTSRCTLKGSILIKKHLKQVASSPSEFAPPIGEDAGFMEASIAGRPATALILTLSLSVAELPSFHLQFHYRKQLEEWRRALLDLNGLEAPPPKSPVAEPADNSETDDEDYRTLKTTKRVSSVNSLAAGRSVTTAPTEYTNSAKGTQNGPMPAPFHIPLDVVVVIPVSASMQGLKISLLRDALKFLVQQLGDKDRMGLVAFGSGAGAVPMVGMTTKAWNGWGGVLNSIRPADRKSLRADVVEGANVAMDLLMQRRSNNPISAILLVSDSSTSDTGDVNFVVSRAEAAKVAIHSFGLGLTHKPDTLVELSNRTKASYTYVKDWMMLRECLAGCLGSAQSVSHQNAKLRMKLPEGSPAKFVKINGALHTTKRAGGRDAEAILGDLRFGDKRDILVQLVIAPDNLSQENLPQDPWETIVSGLEALGGPLDQDESRTLSVEEVPLIQAEVSYGDILRQGAGTSTRPSLLAITMLPRVTSKMLANGRAISPPIPPHPSIVQRRMELLTSDMMSRALVLVSKGQHERAYHLLTETRSILKGLGKGGLPPIPSSKTTKALGALGAPNGVVNVAANGTAAAITNGTVNGDGTTTTPPAPGTPDLRRSPSPPRSDSKFVPAPGIDAATIMAIDAELESSLEWINHPAVFGRDSRKAVLQAIGVISSQRAYTFRTLIESLWAGRISGVKRLTALSREWRETDESLMEET